MLGGDRYGLRLNKLYKENFQSKRFLEEVDYLFLDFVNEKIITRNVWRLRK